MTHPLVTLETELCAAGIDLVREFDWHAGWTVRVGSTVIARGQSIGEVEGTQGLGPIAAVMRALQLPEAWLSPDWLTAVATIVIAGFAIVGTFLSAKSGERTEKSATKTAAALEAVADQLDQRRRADRVATQVRLLALIRRIQSFLIGAPTEISVEVPMRVPFGQPGSRGIWSTEDLNLLIADAAVLEGEAGREAAEELVEILHALADESTIETDQQGVWLELRESEYWIELVGQARAALHKLRYNVLGVEAVTVIAAGYRSAGTILLAVEEHLNRQQILDSTGYRRFEVFINGNNMLAARAVATEAKAAIIAHTMDEEWSLCYPAGLVEVYADGFLGDFRFAREHNIPRGSDATLARATFESEESERKWKAERGDHSSTPSSQ